MLLKRRALMAGAVAAAALPTTACALPERLLQDDAPKLNLIPCDGRELRVCDYVELFSKIGREYGGSVNAKTFRVPDVRNMPGMHTHIVARECVVRNNTMPTPVGWMLIP
jgi:hypothetical protein